MSGILLISYSSCVGVWQNDRVEIIANDQGNRTTPSYVSFSDNECLIGDAAKNQVAMNPHNTYVIYLINVPHSMSDLQCLRCETSHWTQVQRCRGSIGYQALPFPCLQ